MILSGYSVVELATHIAGPGAAGIIADWGAEVIKVETPGGDPLRRVKPGPNGLGPMFEHENRGKRSVVLDYRKPEALGALRELIGRADVFITSVRPDSLARAGLDWASLQAVYPRLIYASVTGYGLEGPITARAAFDNTGFWARSGLAYANWPEGVDPFRFRSGMGDHHCAIATALGIVTALLDRTRTGRGRLVETSLLKSGVHAGAGDMADHLRLGVFAPTPLRGSPGAPLSNYFLTADRRWICLLPLDPVRSWPEIFSAAGRPELAADERFSTAEGRSANVRALEAALDEGFGAMSYAEAAERLEQTNLVWSLVQTPAETAEDPAAIAAGCFTRTDDGEGGTFRAPAAPVRFSGEEDQVKGPVPALGEHTDAVLAEIGYSPADIARLKS